MAKNVTSKDSMVDQAYDAIRNYIIEHGLGIGDVLPPENTFSKQLGVSRNILREALGRYRILGILESRQKVGSVIMRLFPDDPYRCFSLSWNARVLSCMQNLRSFVAAWKLEQQQPWF